MSNSKQAVLTSMNIWNIEDKELLSLLIAREGGKTTRRIIDKLLNKPYNKHQLAKKLKLDYKTISHHIDMIEEHDYATKVTIGKITYYQPSKKLFNSLEEYKFIKEYLKNNK